MTLGEGEWQFLHWETMGPGEEKRSRDQGGYSDKTSGDQGEKSEEFRGLGQEGRLGLIFENPQIRGERVS